MGLFDGTALERAVTCARCGREIAACACPKDAAGAAADVAGLAVRVRRERRRGKWATVVYDLPMGEAERKAMLKTLKAKVSAGGKVTADGWELQGDHRDAVVAWLRGEGYASVKAAGG